MKIPPNAMKYLWLVLAAVVMGGLAAWLLAGMAFGEQFPPTVTLLGMSVTAASLVWPGAALLFTNMSSDLAQVTGTVGRTFAVAGPFLAAAGVILDDKLGWPGFWLSVALGLLVIPLLLIVFLAVISNLRTNDSGPTARDYIYMRVTHAARELNDLEKQALIINVLAEMEDKKRSEVIREIIVHHS